MMKFRKLWVLCYLLSTVLAVPKSSPASADYKNPSGRTIIASVLSVKADFQPDRYMYHISAMATILAGDNAFDTRMFETEVVWDRESRLVRERTTLLDTGITGTLTANCSHNPITQHAPVNSDSPVHNICSGVSSSGLYTNTLLQNIRGQLISTNILTNAQKNSLHSQEMDFLEKPTIYDPGNNQVFDQPNVLIRVSMYDWANIKVELNRYLADGVFAGQTTYHELSTSYYQNKGYHEFSLNLEPGFYEAIAITEPHEYNPGLTVGVSSDPVYFTVMGSIEIEQLENGLAKDTRTYPPIDREQARVEISGELNPEKAKVVEPSLGLNPEKARVVEPPVGLNPEKAKVVEPSLGLNPEKARVVEPPVGLNPEKAKVVEPSLGLNPEKARVVEPPVGLNPEKAKVVEPSPGLSPEKVPVQAIDLSSSDIAITKIPLSFLVPTQNMVFNDFTNDGKAPSSYWFILPNKTDVDLQVSKDSESIFATTISKASLRPHQGGSMGRMYKYQGTLLLPAGKYSIRAKPREGLNQVWSNPVTFYIGMTAALKDSEKGRRATINNPYAFKGEATGPINPFIAKQGVSSGTTSLEGEQINRTKMEADQVGVKVENAPTTKTSTPEITQRSEYSSLPSGINATPDHNLAIAETSGFGVPKIIRPADNSTLFIKKDNKRCIAVEIEIPSGILADNKNSDSQTRWRTSIVWRYYRENSSSPSGGGSYSFEINNSNLIREFCRPAGSYKFKACTDELRSSKNSASWDYIASYCSNWRELTVVQPEQPQQAIESAPSSKTIVVQKPDPAEAKSLRTVPSLLPLPRGKTYQANSLVTLPVKHMTGQKPVFEFKYFDKDRSIRPISMQTPKGGSGQVITQAKFRFAQPGKYRYRVKIGNKFSPYQEFVVVGPHGGLSPQVDHAAAGKGAAGSAALTNQKIAKAPAKSGGPQTPPRSSANELRGSDSISPKITKPLQPTKPLLVTSPKPFQSFQEPANVIVKTSHDSRFKLKFELRKNKGSFIQKNDGKLINLSAGDYIVRVRYDTKPINWEAVEFIIRPRLKKQAVTQQSNPQTPPVQQQQTTPQAQPQVEKVPEATTPTPVRRRAATQ